MPVLQVIGEYDHLIPPEASKPFNEVIGSDDTEIMEQSTGHIGLSVSSSSHDHLWPAVADWFAERSAVEPEPTSGETDDGGATSGDAGTDLQQLDGVGPAYAARLETAGIASVEALADADPAVLAVDADIDEGRLRRWIEDAAGRTA
jgi:polyhydroxyalkanoate synthase